MQIFFLFGLSLGLINNIYAMKDDEGKEESIQRVIQNEKCNLEHSKFPYHDLVITLVNDKCGLEDVNQLLKSLVKNKASINALNNELYTPLAWYINEKARLKKNNLNVPDSQVFNLFFSYGACILGGYGKKCNLVFEILEPSSLEIRKKRGGMGELDRVNYMFSWRAFNAANVCKSRLDAYSPLSGIEYSKNLAYTKKCYNVCFKTLCLLGKRKLQYNLPKAIILLISKLAVDDQEKIADIKAALRHTTFISNNGKGIHSVTPLELVNMYNRFHFDGELDEMYPGDHLAWMLAEKFWNRPIALCYRDLNIILKKN